MSLPHPAPRQSFARPAVNLDKAPLRGRTTGPTRIYDIAWLQADGSHGYDSLTAPAIPVIEAACASLARGAVIATTKGPVAIEDLEPGMMVDTTDHGPLPVRWIGSFPLRVADSRGPEKVSLYRVTADMFGPAKPTADLLMAPRGHVLMRDALCREMFGVDQAFAPVRAFDDGVNVISVTPVSAVPVYNLAFDRQATILANGVEVESFHPGAYAEMLLDDEMLYSLLRLFPHIQSLDAFGPQRIGRLTGFELRALRER